MDHKAKFLRILNTVQRDGIQNLIAFLEGSDFFTAPASSKYHLSKPGGLVEHSLNVYNLLEGKLEGFWIVYGLWLKEKVPKTPHPNDSIIIIGLLHDLCKIGLYKEGGEPELPIVYSVDDSFPLGHGEKSVSIIQEYIKLTNEERLAIRWHMGPFGLSQEDMLFYREAQKMPLVTLLFTADYEASNILEA